MHVDHSAPSPKHPTLFFRLLYAWKLVVALVGLGVLGGGAVTLVTNDRYTATALLYIGQTMDVDGTPVSGVDSDVRAVQQLLASEEVLGAAVARLAGDMTTAELRSRLSVRIAGLLLISVTDEDPARAAAAANTLAAVLIERLSIEVDGKIAELEQQLRASHAALHAAQKRSQLATSALSGLSRPGIDPSSAGTFVAVIEAASAEHEVLRRNHLRMELVLLSLRQHERPQLLHAAMPPEEPSAPLLSVNVAVGALIAVLVAIIAVPLKAAVERTE